MKNSVILPSVSRTTSGLVPSLKQGSRAALVTTSLGGNALKNIMWEEIQMTSTDRTMAQLKPFERGFIPKWSHNEGEINTCEILTLRLSWASALRCLHHTSLFKTKRRNIHLAPETEKKKSISEFWMIHWITELQGNMGVHGTALHFLWRCMSDPWKCDFNNTDRN